VDTTTKKSSPTVSGREPADSKANAKNAELRQRYLQLEEAIEALSADDPKMDRLTVQLDMVAQEFIEANSGLAAYMARRWAPKPTDFEDLYQVGLATMWEYFCTWDPSRATYSTWVMKNLEGDIRRANLKHQGQESYYDRLGRGRLVDAIERLSEQLGRAPSNAEVAAETGMHPDRVARMRKSRPISLDEARTDDGAALIDVLPAKAHLDDSLALDLTERQWLSVLSTATEDLDITELVVLLRRDGLDGWPADTLNKLAENMGIGREILRRTEARAREKITDAGLRLPVPLS